MNRPEALLGQFMKCAPSLIVTLAASALAAQAQVVFSPPVNISHDAGNSGGQQMAIDSSGNINVVWVDNTPGYDAVFFSRSSDGGATFSSSQNLSNGQAGVGGLQIAVDTTGNNIYVSWASPASNGDIFFSRSSDGGATFSAPMIISNHPSGGARGPSMAVDSGGNLNVIWWGTYLPSLLFFSRSSDGGGTFSTPVSMSYSGEADGDGQLAVDSGGNINVVWCDGNGNFQVAFSRSVDGGASFTAPKIISPFSSETCSKTMTALDSAGNIYVVGDLQPNGNIYVTRSTDGGATFSNTNVTNNTTFASLAGERIATDSSGNIYVVWGGPYANAAAIFFSRSSDGGATFSTPQNISQPGAPAGLQIATDVRGNINVVWQDSTSRNSQVFFMQSSDGGGTFSTPQNLSNDSGAPGNPQIATDLSGNINVSWVDSTPGNNDIFFSRSIGLSSLSLAPTSVTGGAGSTGTVTLSGPAPSGGALISLSSSNPTVGSVPDSVTVSEGATSATFRVSTSPVAAPTSAVISGSYNGVTQSASLTVLPPALTSLTVSPSSVIGGLQASTGTVTLSGPAPSGGAVVSLSTSDPSAASVPSSVTVPAGATSATFTVSSSVVVPSTSVTISGFYNNTTQSANLSVLL